ncbi:alpha/beta fold hydrolase [Actinospica robiniae]|uniref:alpha/beta fold hydrolase n=1 Tax=Actinospica robiniae TaxID=304901 RepID=UPI00041F5460|nr:alpha/beta hydrolase [Actinospica robiniae]
MSSTALYLGRDWKLEHDKTARVKDAELKYTVVGQGEPVLLIHCTSIADGLVTPLVRFSPELLEKYQFISYYRAGYNGSTLEKDGLTIEEMADHAAELLDHLGIAKVHLVAYSFGGVIGFQFLRAHADRVHSAALLEPYLPREEEAAVKVNNDAAIAAFGRYQAGERLTAQTSYMTAVCGPDYLSAVELTCPLDVWQRVEEVADITFGVDFSSLGGWDFTMAKAAELIPDKPAMPILSVLGQHSETHMPGFREVHSFLLDFFPQAERAGVLGAGHGLQLQNPKAVGEILGDFFAKHPMA